jgi:hypothetical protein
MSGDSETSVDHGEDSSLSPGMTKKFDWNNEKMVNRVPKAQASVATAADSSTEAGYKTYLPFFETVRAEEV